ncbi:MAG: hypothetical protein HHJ13_04340 [Phycicoccus sp.]|nr:hypothetical protein [Phycicoccus sp.]
MLDPASTQCTTPVNEVTVPTLVWTPGTCTAPGTVNATNTEQYVWTPSGTADGTSYTASPLGNVHLLGDLTQGPFDLSQIPYQSTNPGGACYVPSVDPAVQPKVTLKAAVVNGADGTAQVSDFILTGSSIQVASVAPVQNSSALAASAALMSFSGVTGSAAITNAVVPAGTYFLSESALPSGYSASAWACTGGQLNGSAITVALGNTVECLIANTYSSTVVDSPGVPTADPASAPPVVLGVARTVPRSATPTVTTLAFTGADPVPLSLLALLALVLGVALTVVGRCQGSHWTRE